MDKPIPDNVMGKGWTQDQPTPITDHLSEITEADLLTAMLRLLQDSPHLTGWILTGIEVTDLLTNA